MTYAEAKNTVAGKLIFGDAAQIAAIHWLRDFNELKHAVMNCGKIHTDMAGQYVPIPIIGSCTCVNSLYPMDEVRAFEMIEELRKYLEREANSSGRIQQGGRT